MASAGSLPRWIRALARVFVGGRRAPVPSLEPLKRALDSDSTGHLILDGQGRLILANAVFRSFFSGDPLASLEQCLFQQGAGGALSEVRAGAFQTLDVEVPRAPLQEKTLWLRITGRSVDPSFVHWTATDITAEHEELQALRSEQSRLMAFMDQAPVGFYAADQHGRFRFVNATFARWLGCVAADLVTGGRKVHDLLVDPPSECAPYDLLPGGGAEQVGEVRFIGGGERRFPAHVLQTIVGADGGRKGVRTRTVVRDLTPEREWQEALRLSEQRFQRFFEDAPTGIALVNAGGVLVECNRAFADLTGVALASLPGRGIIGLIRPEGRGELLSRLAALARGEEPPRGDGARGDGARGDGLLAPLEVKLGQEGRERVAQLFVSRLGGPGEAGTNAVMILHCLDTTERRNLEHQFAQSQKMQAVGQLAGGIAHDFNNLLTAMIGFCDLLLLRHKPGDHDFADLMQVKQNANRAANLVRQLLAFSRRQTLQPRVLDISDVLAELSHLLRRLIGENIDLRLAHGRDLGLVRVDQGQLEQVMINLAVNARDAMPHGGRLSLATDNCTLSVPLRSLPEDIPAGDYVRVTLEDTGTGIPPDVLPRIFEPFFTTKPVGAGTGLGLSTVYGIIRQTGGFVGVESTPDAGTRFTLFLPRHLGEQKREAAVDREPRGGDLTGSATILLVEDEDPVRVFAARALRNKGYRVLEARSGEGGLEQFSEAEGAIDLLISDVVMPEMDGPTLLRAIRRQSPGLRAILISGYAEEVVREQFTESGPVHFLPKPFSLKQLAAKVKDVLQDG